MSESEISLSVYNICKVFLCEFPYLFARDIFQFFLNQLQSDFFRLRACIILEIFHQCHQRIGMAAVGNLFTFAQRHKTVTCSSCSVTGSTEAWDISHTHQPVNDFIQRSLDEIVNWLMGMGDIPSFCTACYRAGRTGDRFMSLCKSKQISNCCHPNALMTLMEYLQDYASPETKKVGLELIQKELENIPGEKIRKLTEEHLADIVNGQRDFRF